MSLTVARARHNRLRQGSSQSDAGLWNCPVAAHGLQLLEKPAAHGLHGLQMWVGISAGRQLGPTAQPQANMCTVMPRACSYTSKVPTHARISCNPKQLEKLTLEPSTHWFLS